MDPRVIAWELLPFSFVADWFVDIGGYLQLLEDSLGHGLTFKRGYVTTGRMKESTTEVVGYVPSASPVYYDLRSQYRYTSKNRAKLTSWPRPAYPTLKINLGAYRIASAGALVLQAMTGGRRG